MDCKIVFLLLFSCSCVLYGFKQNAIGLRNLSSEVHYFLGEGDLSELSFMGEYDKGTPELKSTSTAVNYSIGATFLPSVPILVCMAMDDVPFSFAAGSFILSVSGFVVGLSAGHFYAGNRSRGMASIGFRSICAGAGLVGCYGAMASLFSENWDNVGPFVTVAVISGVGILGFALFDIATCPKSVEKYNNSIRDHGGFHLTPEIDVKDKNYGLSLVYEF